MPDTYNPDHLRALLEAAKPGTWTIGERFVNEVYTEQNGYGRQVATFLAVDDAALVTAAVNALPALLDRVRELEGALGEACREWEDEMIDLHAPRTGASWDALARLRAVLAREGES